MQAKINVKRICKNCGKEFFHDNKYYEKQFCSKSCQSSYRKINVDKRLYYVNSTFLQQDCNEKYYFLGFMAADGCCLDTQTQQIVFNQTGTEGKKLVTYLKNLISCDAPIYEIKQKINNKIKYYVRFCDNIFYNDLLYNNITPRKTKTFKIPDYILEDENKLRYFIIGYIDGDGCVGVYHKSKLKKQQGTTQTLDISIVTNDIMAEQLRQNKHFKNAIICPYRKGNVQQVCFNGRKAIEFGSWLYLLMDNNIFHSYKYYNFINYMENRYVLTPGLKQKELHEQIQKDIDLNPKITPKELREKYGISKRSSSHEKWFWRKKHNMTYEEMLKLA